MAIGGPIGPIESNPIGNSDRIGNRNAIRNRNRNAIEMQTFVNSSKLTPIKKLNVIENESLKQKFIKQSFKPNFKTKFESKLMEQSFRPNFKTINTHKS